jgi:hypothetical protein
MSNAPHLFSRRAFVGMLAAAAPLAARPRLARGLARAGALVDGGGPIRFVNTASAAGLEFVLRNGAAGHKYQVETIPGGLGVIDFDGDGWPDLYCVNGASLPSLKKTDSSYFNRLYRNNRNGTFTDVTEKAGVQGNGYAIAVAVGDYNNDGREDIYVAGLHGNTLYRNNGDGTFSDVTSSAGVSGIDSKGRKLWSVAAAWIDYDNDGKLDLFVSNYCDWSPGSDPVCGGVSEATRTYCHPDLYRSEPMLLFHNNGDGTFTDVTRDMGLANVLGKGMGAAVADIDGSGYRSIFIANDNAPNLLLRNRAGRLRESGMESGVAYNGDGRQISGMGAAFGDVDGDGRPDLVMTGLKGETFELFRSAGGGEFEDISANSGLLQLSLPVSGWGCGFADFDNDGLLDLFIAGGGLDTNDAQPNKVFRNEGGRFRDVSMEAGAEFAVSALHRGAAFADFDNDGRIDVAVSSLNRQVELWTNRSPMRNWISVKLEGVRSNCSALGVKVICVAGGKQQVRWVENSVGYASASDLRMHFGLGDARAASLEIHWPSGVVQRVPDVSANTFVRLTEADTHEGSKVGHPNGKPKK